VSANGTIVKLAPAVNASSPVLFESGHETFQIIGTTVVNNDTPTSTTPRAHGYRRAQNMAQVALHADQPGRACRRFTQRTSITQRRLYQRFGLTHRQTTC